MKQLKEKLISTGDLSENLETMLSKSLEPDFLKTLQSSLMFSEDINEFTQIINQMKFIINFNKTDLPFWISDHPVTHYNPIDFGVYGNQGLLCRGIKLNLPLTPKLSLSVVCPESYKNYPDVMEITNREHVVFENSQQVIKSTRYIFSNHDSFNLALKMIRENPTLVTAKKRIIVS